MWTRFWTRLAGCIATSGLLAAAAPDFHAGTGSSGQVKALVLRDRQAHVLVLAEAPFFIPDYAAAEVLKTAEVERPGILLYSSGEDARKLGDVVAAVAAAAGRLEAAVLRWDGTRLSVFSRDGECRAAFFPLDLKNCGGGAELKPPIRSAYQMVDAPRLQHRESAPSPAMPMQAIAIGRGVTIVMIGAGPPRFGIPDHPDAAMQALLRRIGR